MDVPGYGVIREHPDYKAYLAGNGWDMPRVEPVGAGWAHRLTLAGRMTGPVEASVPYYLAERSIEFLRDQRDNPGPFFLAVNFWGPHAPYLPSEPFASMYDPRDIPPWPNFEDSFEGKPPIWRRYRDSFIGEGKPKRTWEECAQWGALYFGFATQIDEQIGRILAALDELNLTENTSVLFSCDHGDLTGAHGGMHDKGGMLCQELYHIPLMGRTPKGARGECCSLPVSNMDLSKTILDLAGTEVPPHMDGRSLVPLLHGETPDDWPDYTAGEFFGNHYAYEARFLVHGGFKYIFHPGADDELYNIEEDPWELTNLINRSDNRDILRACRRRLIDWAKQTDDELCVLCGLFQDREADKLSTYGPASMDDLRRSETELIDDPGQEV
jgi:arylsulfatase A-like enzyme